MNVQVSATSTFYYYTDNWAIECDNPACKKRGPHAEGPDKSVDKARRAGFVTRVVSVTEPLAWFCSSTCAEKITGSK